MTFRQAVTWVIGKSPTLAALVVWAAIKTGRMSAADFRAFVKDMGRN